MLHAIGKPVEADPLATEAHELASSLAEALDTPEAWGDVAVSAWWLAEFAWIRGDGKARKRAALAAREAAVTRDGLQRILEAPQFIEAVDKRLRGPD